METNKLASFQGTIIAGARAKGEILLILPVIMGLTAIPAAIVDKDKNPDRQGHPGSNVSDPVKHRYADAAASPRPRTVGASRPCTLREDDLIRFGEAMGDTALQAILINAGLEDPQKETQGYGFEPPAAFYCPGE